MWINNDVDLPGALVTAQREGRLVVFAGAGVSMGPPSNLPSFQALANSIAAGSLVQRDGEAIDAFLGRVEEKGINVQARTRLLIDVPGSTPRTLHHLLIGLFKDESSVRLVTTNFDRHFTAALRAKYATAEIFTGPALPLGRNFSGLAYLHGAVEKPQSHLVVTDRDFGLAYLADGWATRFLMEMFGRFSVLFVGYGHTDPVMRYLARSFVGPTSRFALTSLGQDDHWTYLGISPVHVPLRPAPNEYSVIDDAIEAWTKTAGMGVFDHKVRVAQLVTGPPPLEPESLDYLRSVLADEVTLRFFVEEASLVEWLVWTESEGFLAPLTKLEPITTGAPQLLAHWFAERFAMAHSREALQFVQRHARTLNPVLVEAIAFHLCVRSATPSADVLRLWSAALMLTPSAPDRALMRFLDKCAATADIPTAVTLFRSLLRPRLMVDSTWAVLNSDVEPRLSVEVALGVDSHELRAVWDRTLKAHIASWHRELLGIAANWFHEAFELLRAAGRLGDAWDPMSYRRSAIEPHEQDHTSDDWGLAVDVARDVIEWVIEHDPLLASATIESWAQSKPPLLQRLAIHGTARRRDLPPRAALELIERRGWLYAPLLKHEAFQLLRAVFAQSDEEAQKRFIAYSAAGRVLPGAEGADQEAARTIDYERYNVAVWLNQVAPESTVAAAHLAALQEQHPGFAPRSHPDMDHWIGGGLVSPQSPKTSEELVRMGVVDAATYLVAYAPEAHQFMGPDREGLMTVLHQTAANAVAWALALTKELVSRKEWKADVWSAVLSGWREAPFDAGTFRTVVELLGDSPQIGDAAPMDVANLIEKAIDRAGLDDECIERLEKVGERLLTASDAIPPGVSSRGGIDWLTSAINHPAGQVALTWIKAISKRMGAAGDQWHGLPDDVRARCDVLLGGTGPNAQLAHIIFASHVHFLFSADRAWTETAVVPLFDWDKDAIRAGHAWEGFLFWGRWNDALFDGMRPYVLQTIGRIAQLGEQADRFSSALAALAAFSQVDPWHAQGWLFHFMKDVAAQQRAHWAGDLGRYAESLSPPGAEGLWSHWLSDYWDARITGVPQPLDDTEKQAMVLWVVALRAHLPAAIDLVLKAPPSTIDHYAFYRLKQSGIAATSGGEVGRLLRGLMASLQTISWDTGEVMDIAREALTHGAVLADMLAVAEDMVRLGCAGGDELRRLASEG